MELFFEVCQWVLLLASGALNFIYASRRYKYIDTDLRQGIMACWAVAAPAWKKTAEAQALLSATVQGHADVLSTHKKAVEHLLRRAAKKGGDDDDHPAG